MAAGAMMGSMTSRMIAGLEESAKGVVAGRWSAISGQPCVGPVRHRRAVARAIDNATAI